MNAIFVGAVRSTGGNNEQRFLLFEHYDTMSQSLAIPDDDRLILSVHYYYTTIRKPDGQWITTQAWEEEDRAYVDAVLAFVQDFMQRTGIPVILDETGIASDTPEAIRYEATRYFYQKAKRLSVPCLWWEDAREDCETVSLGYELISRRWANVDLLEAIMDTVYATSIGTVEITGSSANLRAAADADSGIVGKAKHGERFICLSIADNGWFEIALDTGEVAFVSDQLARLSAD